jgi:hypothetical protein
MPPSSAIATAAPPQSGVRRPWGISSKWTAAAIVCLIVGIVGGFLLGRQQGFERGANLRRELPNGSVLCRPGPWGDLSYTTFNIAAPDAMLPPHDFEAAGTHWFFKGYTPVSFAALLRSTSLPAGQQQALLAPAVLNAQSDGVTLNPTPDQIISLPDDTRALLYQTAAQYPENAGQMEYIRRDTLGISPDTVTLFQHLSVVRGNYYIFSGLSALLSRVPTNGEKVRFLKALSLQRTMMLRLRVTPKSDVAALSEYWAKAAWNTDVQTILQSLTSIPNGSWISILMVLPPLPTQQLYDYPSPTDSTAIGTPVNRCGTWSALNFFNDTPDPTFGDPQAVLQELRNKYFPATGDPRYGDLVLFTKPDGSLVHAAVYIADDICFTKDGNTILDPWMLKSTQELTERYDCQLAPGQEVAVSYYRSKNL